MLEPCENLELQAEPPAVAPLDVLGPSLCWADDLPTPLLPKLFRDWEGWRADVQHLSTSARGGWAVSQTATAALWLPLPCCGATCSSECLLTTRCPGNCCGEEGVSPASRCGGDPVSVRPASGTRCLTIQLCEEKKEYPSRDTYHRN